MNKTQIVNSVIILMALMVGYYVGNAPGAVPPSATSSFVSEVEPTTVDGVIEAVTTTATATEEQTALRTPPCRIPANWIGYRIQATDSLEQLAAATGLDTLELACANGLPTPNLYAGQLLYLPFEPTHAVQTVPAIVTAASVADNSPVATRTPGEEVTVLAPVDAGVASIREPTLPAPKPTPEETLITVPFSGTLPLPTRSWMPQQPTANMNQQMAPVQAANEPALPAPAPALPTLFAPAPTVVIPKEPPLPAPIPIEVTPVDPFALPKAPAASQPKVLAPVEVVPPAQATLAPVAPQQPQAVANPSPTKPAHEEALPAKAANQAQQP